MNGIVNFLDEYLRKAGRESSGAVEANALLDKAGLLKDNPQRQVCLYETSCVRASCLMLAKWQGKVLNGLSRFLRRNGLLR